MKLFLHFYKRNLYIRAPARGAQFVIFVAEFCASFELVVTHGSMGTKKKERNVAEDA